MSPIMDRVKILKANSESLRTLYDGSAATMIGYIKEELPLYIEFLQEYFDGEIEVYEATTNQLTSVFHLKSNYYKEDLNVFIIPLKCFNQDKLGRFSINERFQLGFRWLDDIVSNGRGDYDE